MELILASASPRRQELMQQMQLKFSVIPSGADESKTEENSPDELVRKLSLLKAEYVQREHPDACVVGSDTVVVCEGKILGKPKTEDEAFSMLRMLSGKTHTVYTGIAVVYGDRKLSDYDATAVKFAELSDREIRDYIKTKDCMDKAGAYGIQGIFCKHIEGINGSFYAVMGLPVHLLYKMLEKIGYEDN